MFKKELRKIYKDKRLQLSHMQKEKLDDLLLIQFQKLALPYIEVLLSYWPIAAMNEINTHPITDFIEFRNPGLQIAYPITDFTSCTMTAITVNDETEFIENEYGILEPIVAEEMPAQLIDIVLVPLLVFDTEGYRVGYGKGFYDKFLTACKKDAVKVGLSYFDPVEKITDIDANDIKLDYCITPDKIYDFNN